MFQMRKSLVYEDESYWKERLSPKQYNILRKKGTEPPFSGDYHDHKEKGIYKCFACGEKLFNFIDKFDSGTGWPSFSKALKGAINQKDDLSHGICRKEIICATCGGHLGHLFNDGPLDKGGKRYCIDSMSLDFKKIKVKTNYPRPLPAPLVFAVYT